jgi:hypothetical protein
MNSTSHLLSLPRELRDIIYSNVTHSISSSYMWEHNWWPTPIDFKIEHVPIPSVFQACSQLNKEYKMAAWSKNVSATLSLNFDVDRYGMITRVGYRETKVQQRIEDTLSHVRHSTIHLKEIGGDFDNIWRHCLDDCRELMPKLSSLRIMLENRCANDTAGYEAGGRGQPAYQCEDFLPRLCEVYGNLWRVEARRAYVIRYLLPDAPPSIPNIYYDSHTSKLSVDHWAVDDRTANEQTWTLAKIQEQVSRNEELLFRFKIVD